MCKKIAIIPARYQSSRFPGKPLALIAGKPMIQWVYERTANVAFLDEVYVATDDERIKKCVEAFGGNCLMTDSKHESGTDRLAECVEMLGLGDTDIVLNIQGDEPLIEEQMILDLLSTMDGNSDMGTLREVITASGDIENANIVKVVADLQDYAMYFSRYPIPYNRGNVDEVKYYRHVGVYAYRVGFLKDFSKLPKSDYEKTECLEQLRALENGYKIKVKTTSSSSMGVDTPEQIQQVEQKLMKG